MDKVKIYLALLKKHHFWVLCVVVFLTSIGVWWTGTEWMKEETEKRISKLKSVQSEQDVVIQKRFQANDPTIDEAKSLVNQVSRQVEIAWVKLYETQRPKFQWPAGLREYKEICDTWDLRYPGKEFRDDVRRAFLNTMTQDAVKQRLKDIIQILTITQPAATDEPRGLLENRPDPRKAEPIVNGLVKWGSTTPGATEIDLIFNFPWLDRPILVTDLEMRYAQEDLWVYEFLLDALAKVNTGCDPTKPEKALLKEIIYLKIGQDAAAMPPRSTIMSELASLTGTHHTAMPGFGGGGEYPGMGGGPPGMPGAMPGAMPGMEGSLAPAAPGQGDAQLKDRRYCDVEGKPISAAELDAKLADSQYKLMPVVMSLALNQKELPKLLANLSNAVTPMRITQVQLYEGGGGSRVQRGETIDISNDPRFSLDVTVEIRGMVHIFLPPKTATFPHRVEEAAQAAANGVVPGQAVPGQSVPGQGLPGQGFPQALPGQGAPGVNDGQPAPPDPSAIIGPGAPAGDPAALPPDGAPVGAPAAAPPAGAPPAGAAPPAAVPPGGPPAAAAPANP